MKIPVAVLGQLAAALAVLASACSPPQIAGKPLAPITPEDAFPGVSCSAVRPQTEPDLMAWDPQSRGLLSVLHRQEVVVVRYSAKGCNVELELLSNCHAKGTYQFAPYSSRKFKLAHNENELFAQLPIGALDIAGNLQGSRAIRTDFIFVGIDSLPDDATFRPNDLSGVDCPRATHVVNRVYLGGFAIAAGESRTLDVTSTFLGAEAGGKSDASIRQLDSEGNVDDCERAEREGKANGGCQTPLRIGLLPIQGPAPTSSIVIEGQTLKLPLGLKLATTGDCFWGDDAKRVASSGWYEHDSTIDNYCAKNGLVGSASLQFDAGQAVIPTDSPTTDLLDGIAEFMRQNLVVSVLRIEGHTSNVGDEAKNVALSGQRALAVRQAIVARGVKESRLLSVGFGQMKPIADNADAEGRARNNRVEFHLARVGDTDIGGPRDGGGRVVH